MDVEELEGGMFVGTFVVGAAGDPIAMDFGRNARRVRRQAHGIVAC